MGGSNMRLAVGQAAKADGSGEDEKELNGAFESAAGGEGQSHTERFVSACQMLATPWATWEYCGSACVGKRYVKCPLDQDIRSEILVVVPKIVLHDQVPQLSVFTQANRIFDALLRCCEFDVVLFV